MYYVLNFETSSKTKADLKIDGVIFDEKNSFVANLFNCGESLKNSKYKINVQAEYSQKGKLQDKISVQINRSASLFVVSPKVVELFKELNTQYIEFLEVGIKGNGVEIKDYKIVNILKKVDCISDEKSELIYYSGTSKVYAIDHLYLDEANIPGNLDIFLLDRLEKNVTIVSQRFVDKVNEKELTGFEFLLPEKFTIG